MTFLYPMLLGGMALVGVPIAIHLLFRQQPKRLPFPAFRFLQKRARTNQRRLRLRHLLLLLFRMLLIVLLCLALSRPKLFSERFNIGGGQPVALALIIDTSPSMSFTVGDRTRLQEAIERGRELLDTLPEASVVAVLDSSEPGDPGPLLTPTTARDRLNALTQRFVARPLTDALADAYRFLTKLDENTDIPEGLPRLVVLISDRTPGCWDSARANELARARDALQPPPRHVFVDVGVDQPTNLAITAVEVPEVAVPAGRPVTVRVTVQATDPNAERRFETDLLCRFDDDAVTDKKPLSLQPSSPGVVEFVHTKLAPGPHHVEVSLSTPDSLLFENTRYATLTVREPVKVLVLTDHPDPPRAGQPTAVIWQKALQTTDRFTVRTQPATDAVLTDLSPRDLDQFAAVVLLSVARPNRQGLWSRLDDYVARGGHLIVAPGEDAVAADYQVEAALRVLPAVPTVVLKEPKGVPWDWTRADFRHPLLAPFKLWDEQPEVDPYIREPNRAFRFWEVRKPSPANVLVRYAVSDQTDRPALLERVEGRPAGAGRCLLFTTPLDDARDAADRPANDYLQNSFYFVLAGRVMSYLVGDDETVRMNFPTGGDVVLPLPISPRFPSYTLAGPGLSVADSLVRRAGDGNSLRLRESQTGHPGNFTLVGGDRQWLSRFSVNVPASESDLSRLAIDELESFLGSGAVLPVSKGVGLDELLAGRFAQPVELFPWLLLALLAVLLLEGLLANQFYREGPNRGEPVGVGERGAVGA